jgi:ATP-dependent DNA ligase
LELVHRFLLVPGSRDGVVKVKPHKTADCVVIGVRWKVKPTQLASPRGDERTGNARGGGPSTKGERTCGVGRKSP